MGVCSNSYAVALESGDVSKGYCWTLISVVLYSEHRKKEDYYNEEHQIKWEIEKQPSSYYSDLCNRWVSLAGVSTSIKMNALLNMPIHSNTWM